MEVFFRASAISLMVVTSELLHCVTLSFLSSIAFFLRTKNLSFRRVMHTYNKFKIYSDEMAYNQEPVPVVLGQLACPCLCGEVVLVLIGFQELHEIFYSHALDLRTSGMHDIFVLYALNLLQCQKSVDALTFFLPCQISLNHSIFVYCLGGRKISTSTVRNSCRPFLLVKTAPICYFVILVVFIVSNIREMLKNLSMSYLLLQLA